MSESSLQEQPFVSVIVPVYNDERRIADLIKSLQSQDYPKDHYEIIVIDNGSTDNTKDVISSYSVNLLEETDIQSSYAARNKGLAASKGQVLAFTDSDCIANDSWISAGVSALRENDAFLAGGDVAFTFSKSASPAEYYDAICNMRIKEHVEQFGMCFTANLFVRREVIDDLGTFPSTLQSGGDAFFTSRATMAGYKLVFAEDAVVEHPTRKLGASCCKAMRTWKGKMQLMLRSKKKGPKNKSATPGWFLTNINPVILRRRLIIDGYGAGLLRLTGVILTAYIILFVGLIGAFAGMIPEKNNR